MTYTDLSGEYELMPVIDTLKTEIPKLGLSSGEYEIEGEIGWHLRTDGEIEFTNVDLTVRLLRDDGDTYVWEWSNDDPRAGSREQKLLNHKRAVDMLETFTGGLATSGGSAPTIADVVREEIRCEDPDIDEVLRVFEC